VIATRLFADGCHTVNYHFLDILQPWGEQNLRRRT